MKIKLQFKQVKHHIFFKLTSLLNPAKCEIICKATVKTEVVIMRWLVRHIAYHRDSYR